MNRTPVTSSNVASVGYDQNTLTLEVEFHSAPCTSTSMFQKPFIRNLWLRTRSVGTSTRT